MALSDHKITAGDFAGKDIASLPDQVTGQAVWLKKRFDEISKSVLAPKFNALVEELSGSGGAAALGTAQNLKLDKAVLSESITQIRRADSGKLEVQHAGQWEAPPAGHVICNTHGQTLRQTDKLQFIGADVFVEEDKTVVQVTGGGEGGGTGLPGRDGADGQDGKSAYDLAVEGGYTGTRAEFSAQMADLQTQSGKIAALSSGNLLLNSNLRAPVNLAGASSYTGAKESITGWRIRSPGGTAQVAAPLTAGHTTFVSGASGDELVQSCFNLGFLAGTRAVFSASVAPLAGATFQLVLRAFDAKGASLGNAESAVHTVPVFNSGTFLTVSASLQMDALFNNSCRLEVALKALGPAKSYLLSWAKLEQGAGPTAYVTPSPLLERAAALSNPSVLFGSYTGNGVLGAEGQFISLGFTPSALFVMLDGRDFYSAINTYLSHVSGHFALAFRDLPYVSYDGEGGVEIVTDGFIARSGSSTKSHFNSADKTVRYVAFR